MVLHISLTFEHSHSGWYHVSSPTSFRSISFVIFPVRSSVLSLISNSAVWILSACPCGCSVFCSTASECDFCPVNCGLQCFTVSNLDITRDKSGNTDIGAGRSYWTDTAAVSLFTEPPVCVYKEASAICQGD